MNKTGPAVYFAKSTFVWILGLFVLGNLCWGFIRPLQAVPHTSQPNLELSKAALRYKMDKLSKGSSPDVLIVGSSLPMCAFFYTEGPPYFDLAEGDRIRQLQLNLLQSYPKAGYFHAKLKELSGKDLEVFNFAGAACMVSDSKLVIERCLAANRKPKILIYGLGLRDFVDNVNPPPGETPYYRALCNTNYLLAHLSQLAKFNAFTELSMAAFVKFYDLRNEFRISAEHLACNTFHHPSSIELAFMLGDLNRQLAAAQAAAALAPTSIGSASPVVSPANTVKLADPGSTLRPLPIARSAHDRTLAVLTGGSPASNGSVISDSNATPPKKSEQSVQPGSAGAPPASSGSATETKPSTLAVLDYPQRYTPANFKRLNAEMQELREVIALCKQKGIKLVLVNMPVSQGHKTVSPPGLRDEYLAQLRPIAKSADLFIDGEETNLADTSFFDTVHLNGTGSVQFVDDLSKRLQSSGLLNSNDKN